MSFPNSVVKIIHAFARPEEYQTGSSTGTNTTFAIANRSEFCALIVHAIMVSHGFRLVGFGEDDNFSSLNLTQLAIPEPERLVFQSFPLEQWRSASGLGGMCFGFRYKHAQSAMTFIVKAVPMGDQLVVLARALEHDKIYQITMKDMIASTAADFPCDIRKTQLHTLFNMIPKLKELYTDFEEQISGKLVEKSASASAQLSGRSGPERPPATSRPPAETRPSPYIVPNNGHPLGPRNPFSIGDRDLNPLAPLMPPTAGGGMIVGPEHPMFQGGGIPDRLNPLHPHPELLPPGAVPPGARFDPISPLDNRIRPPGRPGAPPGTQPRFPPRSGEPDFDELTPPGYSDMFM